MDCLYHWRSCGVGWVMPTNTTIWGFTLLGRSRDKEVYRRMRDGVGHFLVREGADGSWVGKRTASGTAATWVGIPQPTKEAAYCYAEVQQWGDE